MGDEPVAGQAEFAAAEAQLTAENSDGQRPERLSPERVEELATELAAMADFRRATRSTDKELVARKVPALAELHGQRDRTWEGRWDVDRVISIASDLLEREREDYLVSLQAQPRGPETRGGASPTGYT